MSGTSDFPQRSATEETPMVEIPNPPTRPAPGNNNNQFVNPYNFVSTPTRNLAGQFGDGPSASHGTVTPGTYSARIPVRLTTKSPLLLPDHPSAVRQEGEPATLSTRTDPAGTPILTGSTIKGVLRASYEAITNSRYGVFDSRHELPGAIRALPNEALGLRPAVVIRGSNGLMAMTVKSLVPLGEDGNPYPDITPQPAAWLPISKGRSFAQRIHRAAWTLDKMPVVAWIHLQRHTNPNFYMWRVSNLASDFDALPEYPDPPPQAHLNEGFEAVRVRGYIHWTGGTFDGKNDERLVVTKVFEEDHAFARVDLDPKTISSDNVREWKATIDSYARANEHRSEEAQQGLASYILRKDQWKLEVGRTLHARVERDRITQVTPAMVGRSVFGNSPHDLTAANHLPAQTLGELSPADRVFGWVADGREERSAAAVKGHLRIAPPRVTHCPAGGAVEHIPGGPLPLTVLNGPKSSQYRFYTSAADNAPIGSGPRRGVNGFRDTDKLRGRKFYLPHRDVIGEAQRVNDYWRSRTPQQRVQVQGRHRYPEHVAVEGTPANVSVSVTDWVAIGVQFATEIIVDNLTATELGALLWLLALPEDAVYTVGMGRPLGFGATRIEAIWERVRIEGPDDITERYRSLTRAATQLDAAPDSGATAQDLINDFDRLLFADQDLRAVRTEFLNAVIGYRGFPVHYPRVRTGNTTPPRNNGYEWWTNNETPTNRKALKRMHTNQQAPTLPYL
ncbi:TIGR03986 family type III CRISPR-associated RAMP protein [Gordonia pseudamarae]